MTLTTMRVSKRTAKLTSFIASALEVRGNETYTADDVVWDALTRAYPEHVQASQALPNPQTEAADSKK